MYEVKRLNKKMKEVVEYMLSHPYCLKKDIVDDCKVTIMTLYNWERSPVFIEYYDQRLKEEWEDSIRKSQRRMEDLAAQGNFQANKYILDAGGFGAPTKIEANVTSQVIKIDIDDDE